MKFIAGKINGEYLQSLHMTALDKADQLYASVAYVGNNIDFFKDYFNKNIPVVFYGRFDYTIPVSINCLEYFMKKKSPNMICKLVPDIFHPKILWWKGYGAYIGSANLTQKAWYDNIEAGVFYYEDELVNSGLHLELDNFFDVVEENAFELTDEYLDEIRQLKDKQKDLENQRSDIFAQHKKKSKIPKGRSLISVTKVSSHKKHYEKFEKEWNSTIQHIRNIADRVSEEYRPSWVPADTPKGAQADQFLHAFYYKRCFDGNTSIYNDLYMKNSKNREAALVEAMEWWKNDYNKYEPEEKMLLEWLPLLQNKLSKDSLANMSEDDFLDICSHVHAIRDYARRVPYERIGIKDKDISMTLEERLPVFANYVFALRNGTRSINDNLMYLLYDERESDIVSRLWKINFDEDYKLPHTGISTYGEIIGWAMPDLYPPRNGRTNKALRALGYDVKVYG